MHQVNTSTVRETSAKAHKLMKKRGKETGSKPVQHLAEGLKTQHEMMVDKELLERFQRISHDLEEVKKQSPKDFDRTRRQLESLRPLLRLSLRSVDFRNLLLSFLRILKHVWEKSGDAAAPMMREGEPEDVWAARQAALRVSREREPWGMKKREVISEEEWDRIFDQLGGIFSQFSHHRDFQKGLHELFELPSIFEVEVLENKPMKASEKAKEDSKDLIAQFSGRKVLDRLFDQIDELRVHYKDHEEIQKWWIDFRECLEKTAKTYSRKEDLECLRKKMEKGSDLFEDFRPKIDAIIDTITEIFNNMSNDKYVKELQERLSILSDDLYWIDNDGNKRFNTDAAQELAASVTGILRDQLKHVSLPDFEGSHKSTRFSISDLTISAKMPTEMHFHLESDITLSEKKNMESELSLVASIKKIKIRADAVKFSYDSSMFSEKGVMDVRIPSAELSVEFVYSPTSSSEKGFEKKIKRQHRKYQFLRVTSHFDISSLEITFDKSSLKHRILSPALTTIFKHSLTQRFESGLQDSLNQGLEATGEKISEFLEQVPLANLYSLREAEKNIE